MKAFGKIIGIIALVMTAFAGISMVTNVRFWSFKEINPRARAPFAALLVAMIALVLTASTPALVLFGFFICYAVSGYVMVLVRAGRRRPAANAAPAVPPAGISASARDDDTPSA